jgi:hypothetical protein
MENLIIFMILQHLKIFNTRIEKLHKFLQKVSLSMLNVKGFLDFILSNKMYFKATFQKCVFGIDENQLS